MNTENKPTKDNNLSDKIWREFREAKLNEIYLCKYLSLVRGRKRYYKIALIGSGVLGVMISQSPLNNYYASGVFVLIIIIELCKSMLPELMPDEQLLDKLPDYRLLYVKKSEKLEEIMIRMDYENIPIHQAIKMYLRLKKINIEIENVDNSFRLPAKKGIFKEAEQDLELYIKNHFKPENDD